jgi:phosphoglycerate dehydrogenase-like enzyme
MKLLIYNEDITGEQLEELRALSDDLNVVLVDSDEAAAQEIGDADALYGRVMPELFAAAKKLRWIQAPIAGLEHYLFDELVASDVPVTNMRGIYSDHLADHGFAFVLALARDLPKLFQRQVEGVWEKQENVAVMHLADTTLGIIGLGGIGYEVARRGRVCGMRVLAVDPRRTDKPAEVDELWPAGRLDDLLSQSDFVVICAPQTPETEGMIGAEELRRMKATAFLINIGRGVIVKLDALVDALRSGQIAGAALDVYEIEPLPPEHPLWKMDNVLLTPHVAGIDPHTLDRRFGVLRDNLRRFLAGEPLANVVDKRHWF